MVWHWSTDIKKFKKEAPEEYKIWKIIQQINYGLEKGEKLSEKEVRKYWREIRTHLDPYKSRLVEYLLWQKQYSLPTNLTFWNLPVKTH